MSPQATYPNPILRRRIWPVGDIQRPGLWWRVAKRICQLGMAMTSNIRVIDRHYEPTDGGAVYISNHQSFLDPVLMSLALRRPMHYMARDTLFKVPILRPIIESLNSIPLRRGTADTGAIKEAMRRLKKGAQVVVFAEGTRTDDGRINPFLPGVAILAQRAAKWTVPVVIDGAFEAWPRTQLLPSAGARIVVRYGKPISQEEARASKPAEFVENVRRRLIVAQTEVRARAGLPVFDYTEQAER